MCRIFTPGRKPVILFITQARVREILFGNMSQLLISFYHIPWLTFYPSFYNYIGTTKFEKFKIKLSQVLSFGKMKLYLNLLAQPEHAKFISPV